MSIKRVVWLAPVEFNQIRINNKELTNEVQLASWLTKFIDLASNIDNIDLTIISYSTKVKKDIKFSYKKVDYYILKLGIPFISKGYSKFRFFDLLSKYKVLRSKIQRIIRLINPDIIHVHGTEHPYSRVALDIKRIPIIVQLLGTPSSLKDDKSRRFAYNKKSFELITKKCKNFAVNVSFIKKEILSRNHEAKFFFLDYPINSIDSIDVNKQPEKKTDIVFSSRLTLYKGIEDLLQAIYMVKVTLPSIKVKIFGHGSTQYLDKLNNLITELGIQSNVTLIGYLKNHKSIINEIRNSKIMVLPTYADVRPTVVCESMLVGTPVIAYDIDGLPDLIVHNKTGLLSSYRNIQSLSKMIERLLSNSSLLNRISANAFVYAKNRFNDKKIISELLTIYNVLEK